MMNSANKWKEKDSLVVQGRREGEETREQEKRIHGRYSVAATGIQAVADAEEETVTNKDTRTRDGR